MTNFLEGLVLRAAGLPPSAAAAPRSAPVAEPLEAETTLEEVIDETAAPRMADAPRPETIVRERIAAPPSTPEPERVVEVREVPVTPEPFRMDGRETEPRPPVDVVPAPPEPEVVTRLVEREVIRESAAPPPEPALTQVEAPRAEMLPPIAPPSREEPVSPPPAAHEAREEAPRAEAPVVVQPVIVDRTRTVIEPVREERIVETERELVTAPATPQPRADAPPQPVSETRAEVQPRAVSPAPDVETKTVQPRTAAELPREEQEPEQDDETAPPPQTLVLPQPAPAMAEAPLLEKAEREPPPVTIRIGTIEVRAAAPQPPTPVPAPAPVIQQLPEPAPNFDDYSRIRRYAKPEVW